MDQAPGGSLPGMVAADGRVPAAMALGDLHGDLAELGLSDVAEIASGGFATVYRARQEAMGRTVAVKVLTAAVDDALVRSRFQRECQALGVLSDHPSIVTVFDAGFTAAGRPYLVLELMAGSLAGHVEQHGSLDWVDVVTVGVRIAGALHSAHEHGVLHRDVKPANIMISEYGSPKLGDFGIARLLGSEHTRTGTLTGSLAHAAPELLGGGAPSVRSDLYALGSTLFTLLRGETAFVRATDESIIPALARITTSPTPDLRTRGVPSELCDVVEQLMAKRPDERPASAAETGRMLQDVQRAVGVPVTELPVADPTARSDAAAGTAAPPAPVPPPPTARRRAARAPLLLGAVVLAAAVLLWWLPQGTPLTPVAEAPAPLSDEVPMNVTGIAGELAGIRGLPADVSVSAVLVPRPRYSAELRAWSTAGREDALAVEQRILTALHLIPGGTDLVTVTQDLYAEQFLGFTDGRRITVRADAPGEAPSALQRSIAADEVTGVLLDERHDVTRRTAALTDDDARRAWQAMVQGDVAVTAAAWSERFLDADEQHERATELSAQPDRLARALPDALRAELVFPYVAGEAFVRDLFAKGGVAAIEQAYAAPPATTEQLLHPEKYRRREPALPVTIPRRAPDGWAFLADRSFGEFDVRRLTSVLGPRRSVTAAQGWGGGRLRAWQRAGDTAVRISLRFDTARDARQGCSALRDAHVQRSDAVPVAPDVLISSDSAAGLRCGPTTVDLAVAPDRATAAALLEP
jgi:tRNA A-37 threonylcarbamoyl transferase component Bud32